MAKNRLSRILLQAPTEERNSEILDSSVSTGDPSIKLTEEELDKLLHLATKAGQKMLEAGAETYRVEDTMSAILSLTGAPRHTYVLMTGLTACIEPPGLSPKTLVRRVAGRNMNLFAIHMINQVSRDLVAGRVTIDQAEETLDAIDRDHYSTLLKSVSTLLMSGAFALLLSGSFIDALASLVNGVTLLAVNTFSRIAKVRPMFSNFLAGMFATLGARLVQSYLFPTANYDMIIAGSLMLMFPGTAITNAIRDTINGDYVSGSARAMEAFLVAASLALGTGIGLWISGGLWAW